MKTLVLILALCAPPAMAQDAFDVHRATIVNAPDVRGWPATATITGLSFDGSTTRIAFSKQDGPDRWPDVVPQGWSGPLQYTLWLCLQVNSAWTCSGFIQFWHDRDGSGSASDPDVPSVYDKHWFYAERWSPLFGHGQIHAGESIGFLVTSGNARDSVGPYGPQERSNVVVIPATDRGAFSFTPQPLPIPTPPPTPIPAPQPLPSVDLSGLIQQAAINHASLMAELAALKAQLAALKADVDDFHQQVRSKYVAVMDSPIVRYGIAVITGWLVTKAANK